MEKRGKRGLSPIIASVLLIAIVVILAIIIFLWARGFITEVVEKEIAGVEKSADKFCADVEIVASLDTVNEEISIVNRGNVPIYKIEVKQEMLGSSEIDTSDLDGGLDKGDSIEIDIDLDSATNNIKIIPVLLGQSGEKKKEYTCPEEYAYEIEV